jgi:hypothetical protein
VGDVYTYIYIGCRVICCEAFITLLQGKSVFYDGFVFQRPHNFRRPYLFHLVPNLVSVKGY